jgi:hypothetical protein
MSLEGGIAASPRYSRGSAIPTATGPYAGAIVDPLSKKLDRLARSFDDHQALAD